MSEPSPVHGVDLTARSRAVTSKDGTTISYLSTGRGQPVIVVPGALSTAASYAAFASVLGQTHAVHTIERRGRGQSGPQGGAYGMDREIEDLEALRAATGSSLIFGHSYGGLIALEAARAHPAIEKVAVYEPGVSVDGSIAMEWMADYKVKLARNKPLDAFAGFSIGAGPTRARSMPHWLMKRLLPLFIPRPDRARIFDLLEANLREHEVVGDLDNNYRGYKDISADVLIMSGDKSGLDWVPLAAKALSEAIPATTTRVFPRLDHLAPTKSGSAEIADAVRAFFSG